MSIYQYLCNEVNHVLEENFPLGQAHKWIFCPIHLQVSERYYGNCPNFINADEYRSSYLNSSTHYDDNAPKCKEDVKLIYENTGRIYHGNDISKLNLTQGMKESYARYGDFRDGWKRDKK